ncbi:MAG TPA: bifunctional 4-hydroxy-2-oxoglutarate aldolase/2-dehydro-3-deoxy-phosphogluconate aldolase [Caldilineaceae bacterium]|nr:bifunctional 4-hydroxy-2-oxoglutarate aldolase/2-dehydro-3-deoxy-phosphogluconate aldolase [Caldilineaceae bacterium]
MPTQIEAVAERIRQTGLVAIVRGNFSKEQVLNIGRVLRDNGVPVMEVTLNTTSALESITQLRKQFGGEMVIGAGTVRTAAQFDQALAAGAEFTVAPNLDMDTVRVALQNDVLHLPGVFTPTEAQNAYVAGCKIVKLFPSDIMGPRYIKAIRAPLDDIGIVPTGGISADNIAEYVNVGIVAAGIGSALVTGPTQDLEDLARRAQALRKAWDAAVKK